MSFFGMDVFMNKRMPHCQAAYNLSGFLGMAQHHRSEDLLEFFIVNIRNKLLAFIGQRVTSPGYFLKFFIDCEAVNL